MQQQQQHRKCQIYIEQLKQNILILAQRQLQIKRKNDQLIAIIQNRNNNDILEDNSRLFNKKISQNVLKEQLEQTIIKNTQKRRKSLIETETMSTKYRYEEMMNKLTGKNEHLTPYQRLMNYQQRLLYKSQSKVRINSNKSKNYQFLITITN